METHIEKQDKSKTLMKEPITACHPLSLAANDDEALNTSDAIGKLSITWPPSRENSRQNSTVETVAVTKPKWPPEDHIKHVDVVRPPPEGGEQGKSESEKTDNICDEMLNIKEGLRQERENKVSQIGPGGVQQLKHELTKRMSSRVNAESFESKDLNVLKVTRIDGNEEENYINPNSNNNNNNNNCSVKFITYTEYYKNIVTNFNQKNEQKSFKSDSQFGISKLHVVWGCSDHFSDHFSMNNQQYGSGDLSSPDNNSLKSQKSFVLDPLTSRMLDSEKNEAEISHRSKMYQNKEMTEAVVLHGLSTQYLAFQESNACVLQGRTIKEPCVTGGGEPSLQSTFCSGLKMLKSGRR